jgi:hypothetical protein
MVGSELPAAADVAVLTPANTAARTLVVGAEIQAALDDSVTSRRDTVGQTVSAHVRENVVASDGKTLIAAGTPIRLSITRIRPARSKNSQGRLALQAKAIALNGRFETFKADLKPFPRELRGRGVTGSDAAKVGGGAAAGQAGRGEELSIRCFSRSTRTAPGSGSMPSPRCSAQVSVNSAPKRTIRDE